MKHEASMRAATVKAAKETATAERDEKTMQQQKPKSCPSKKVKKKNIDVSITIGIAGSDVEGEVFDKLTGFMQEHASMGIMAFERGDAHLLLHIQGMMTVHTTSTRKLKQDVKTAIGWDTNPPIGNSVFRKCIKEMVPTGQYMPAIRWLSMAPFSLYRVETLWRSCVSPEDVTIADVDHVIFGQPPSERYMSSSHWTEPTVDINEPDPKLTAAGLNPSDGVEERKPEEHEVDDARTRGKHAISDSTADKDDIDNKPAENNGDEHVKKKKGRRRSEYRGLSYTDAKQLAKEKHPEVVDMDETFESGADRDLTENDLLAAGYMIMKKRNKALKPVKGAIKQEPVSSPERETSPPADYIPLVRPTCSGERMEDPRCDPSAGTSDDDED
ncbi:hypothetical protein R1sor_001889 [Riccia sorocarpa]|uniref:Uncharacterized protein n=1 Tax=Riccia sorocarpa TaxID=122646 RepID=A0ABD3GX75_9MARC